MEDILKKRLILILAGFNILFLLIAVGQCNNARIQKTALDKERETRYDSEEKISKYTQDQTILEDKLRKAEEALEQEQASAEATKKALAQEQLVNQSLKSELDKISRLKEILEADLKKALAGGKPPSAERTKK